jgi:hypothetical protein
MSQFHLHNLEQAIKQAGLLLSEKGSGNGYDIAADWTIKNQQQELHILFEGTAENSAHVPSNSYACYLAEHPDIHLYFDSEQSRFAEQAAAFIASIQSSPCYHRSH